jgi:hypothetical protein
MATAWAAPVPHCPDHGRMTFNETDLAWHCHGYDGEGCPTPPVPAAEMGWTNLGQVETGASFDLAGLRYDPSDDA